MEERIQKYCQEKADNFQQPLHRAFFQNLSFGERPEQTVSSLALHKRGKEGERKLMELNDLEINQNRREQGFKNLQILDGKKEWENLGAENQGLENMFNIIA